MNAHATCGGAAIVRRHVTEADVLAIAREALDRIDARQRPSMQIAARAIIAGDQRAAARAWAKQENAA